MADAGPRRDDPQISELALSPTQQRITLLVALHLFCHVQPTGVRHARVVDLNGVVDHQVDGNTGVDDRGIASAPRHGRAQRGQVDHAGNAGEVLQ